MIELLEAGGWIMIPIGICLFLTLSIAVERLVNLRMGRYMSEEILDKIRGYLVNNDYEAALQVCQLKNLLFNRIVETAITYRHLDAMELRQLLEDQSRQEASELERFLTTLRTVATVAPLLGLLGTVAGMIKVFQELSVQGLGQAPNLAGGISEALITTATGLSVAIPAIVLHNYFERRIGKLLLRMEKRIIEMVLLLRSGHAVSSQA